ncbi:MAG: sugar ABC transporter permease [Firmicutes bacterium]|jgi:N-acetylglucosamine transport system permease protein|nr:sugar ABC transporter permease [Bacillota bacterium]
MKQKGSKIFVYSCIAPALLLFAVFMIYPTISVFRMSLYEWGGLSARRTFVGLKNFKVLLDDRFFLRSFQNTVLIITLVTIITLSIAIIFAYILIRERIKGENFFRVVFYIPNILSIAVIAAVFSAIYAPDQGLINGLGRLLNPDTWVNIQFLGNPRLVVYSVIGAMVWQAIGYYMVMYMASMGSIPTHLYEAAQIEGANRVRQFVDITLPLIWETVRTTLVFFIISSINISFLLVNVLTGGGPNGASEVFLSYLYRQAYNNASYGYGMAIGVVVFLFSFALAGLVSLVTKRDVVQY